MVVASRVSSGMSTRPAWLYNTSSRSPNLIGPGPAVDVGEHMAQ